MRKKKGMFLKGKALLVGALVLALVPMVALAQPLHFDGTPVQVSQAPAAGPAPGGSVRFKRVMIVVLENANYDEAIKQPFLASLTRRGASLTQFSGVAHPSQPNYIALISGSTHGVSTDQNVITDARNVGDLLEAKGLRWKVYAEGYPGNCFLGAEADGYVRKHLPFLSFKNIQSNPTRCMRIVDASELSRDIRAGTLPEYSLYIPDLRNDGHDTGVSHADQWLSATFGPLLQERRFSKDLLLIVTFDEAKSSQSFPSSNYVLTVLLGDSVEPGTRSDEAYNHYSLLRLVEDEFGLGSLGKNDAHAPAITGIWR
jgi:Phosphoesterase family